MIQIMMKMMIRCLTDITIEEGDTVDWVWEGVGHNVKSIPRGTFGTAGDDSTTFNSPFTYSYTFMDIGIFDFECVPHSSIMYGTINCSCRRYIKYR